MPVAVKGAETQVSRRHLGIDKHWLHGSGIHSVQYISTFEQSYR